MPMFQTTRWSQVLATRADDAEGRVASEVGVGADAVWALAGSPLVSSAQT